MGAGPSAKQGFPVAIADVRRSSFLGSSSTAEISGRQAGRCGLNSWLAQQATEAKGHGSYRPSRLRAQVDGCQGLEHAPLHCLQLGREPLPGWWNRDCFGADNSPTRSRAGSSRSVPACRRTLRLQAYPLRSSDKKISTDPPAPTCRVAAAGLQALWAGVSG